MGSINRCVHNSQSLGGGGHKSPGSHLKRSVSDADVPYLNFPASASCIFTPEHDDDQIKPGNIEQKRKEM